jgi:two-component system, chemotaxis family, chemotaxis protein CheY
LNEAVVASLEYLSFLVVDDTAYMRSIVSVVLRGLGVTDVREANNATDAIGSARGWAPDIIITDLQMDGMSGLAFTRCVRRGQTGIDVQTPIILMTGHSEMMRVEAARDAGVNEFLAKPVSVATLLSRIAAVIDNPRPFLTTKAFIGPDRRRLEAGPEYQGPLRRLGDPSDFELEDGLSGLDVRCHG